MSKPRYTWWSYAKSMIRRYPDKDTPDEKAAVDAAIESTKRLKTGADRMKVAELVLFKHSHSLTGAALAVHVSERTAQRYHADFIREVGRNFRCETLLCADTASADTQQQTIVSIPPHYSGDTEHSVRLNDKHKQVIVLMAECNMKQVDVALRMKTYSPQVWHYIEQIKNRTGLDARKFLDLRALLEMLDVQTERKAAQ